MEYDLRPGEWVYFRLELEATSRDSQQVDRNLDMNFDAYGDVSARSRMGMSGVEFSSALAFSYNPDFART